MNAITLFDKMLRAMVGEENMPVLQIQERHPSEIKVGDRINHAGAVVEVTAIQHNELRHNYCFDIRDEYTGGRNWVFYFTDAPYCNIVKRYE